MFGCMEILGNNVLVNSNYYCKSGVKNGFNIASLIQHLQAAATSQHLYDVMFDKEPVSFWNQRGCN